MLEVVLTYPTPEGSREIAVDSEKISFGRGSEVDFRFDDSGLSRLNSTVYREGDQVWIVDENSTNGTFVNGQAVGASGMPLRDSDTIEIGNQTKLQVRISEKISAAPVSSPEKPQVVSASPAVTSANFLPLVIIGFAFLVVVASAVFIGVTVLGNDETRTATNFDEYETPEPFTKDRDRTEKRPTPKQENSNITAANTSDESTGFTDSPTADQNTTTISAPSGKKYLEMSDAERSQYIEAKAMKVARMIGNQSTEKIPPAAVERIKSFVSAYASRIKVKPLGGCRFGDNLQSTYERASKNAPFIIHAFNEKGIDPQIGLYLAMIESEHCVCLQSPTGPLGMFQFTRATGRLHGLSIKQNANPSNPDERCEPEPSARAAASYMKALTLRFGTGPLSVPLAIGSYNSGEGGLSTNLKTALEANETQERSFWTLVANAEKLSQQFKLENVKYVPKFFAAAIVGENPQDFGLNLQPLSTYSK